MTIIFIAMSERFPWDKIRLQDMYKYGHRRKTCRLILLDFEICTPSFQNQLLNVLKADPVVFFLSLVTDVFTEH